MTKEVFARLRPRVQHIFPAAAYAVLVVVFDLQSTIFGQDMIFFVDNEAATSALIRGTSREEDVAAISRAVHCFFCFVSNVTAGHGLSGSTRISNCSDGLLEGASSELVEFSSALRRGTWLTRAPHIHR